MRISTILFILFHFQSFSQDTLQRIEFSGGVGKTLLVHLRPKYTNGLGRESYSTFYGPVSNIYDVTFGVNYKIFKKRAFTFESGVYISGASASTVINLSYIGIDRHDSYLTESMRYHFYCVEIPLRIGFQFSKKYPISLTAGIVPALGLINVSQWKYVKTNSTTSIDANGNWITSTTASNHDESLQSPGAIIGTCAELKIPVIPKNHNWASISVGINSYFTPLARIEHLGSFGTNKVVRLSHQLYYVRINIPFKFSFVNNIPKSESIIRN